MISDTLKALLVANSGVSTLVGTQIYDGVLPRGFTLPAVAYHIVNAPAGYTFAGSANPQEVKFQFDFYGDTAAQVHAVQAAVKLVLQDLRGAVSGFYILGAFWEFDQDMPFEPAINKVVVGFRSISQITVKYLCQ